jgi:hypothetical protein
MLNLPKKIACMIAGAGCLMLVNGGIALADDTEICLNVEGQIEALDRIGACSRAIEGGLSGDQLDQGSFPARHGLWPDRPDGSRPLPTFSVGIEDRQDQCAAVDCPLAGLLPQAAA